MFRKLFKRFIFYSLGCEWIFLISVYVRKLIYGNYIQCVTYHDTSFVDIESFQRQLIWYKKHFSNCNFEDLERFLNLGEWNHDRPGIIISFDDGLMSNYNVAAPLLEEFGFTGWFMIPAKAPNLHEEKQIEFAFKRRVDYDCVNLEGNVFMGWNQLKEIKARGHVIGCHSMNHIRLHDSLEANEVYEETFESKNILELNLQDDIRVFAWVGGELWAYGKSTYLKLLDVGYEFIFCTNCKPIKKYQDSHFLERYHVGSDFQLREVRVVLGGLYDVLYFFKRWQVSRQLSS